MHSTPLISWEDFLKVEIRVATILEAEELRNARKPAYVLTLDFGEYGIMKSSAQITELYRSSELVGKQIAAVVNFPPKQIAGVSSQCLVLGTTGDNRGVTLLQPEQVVQNGLRIA